MPGGCLGGCSRALIDGVFAANHVVGDRCRVRRAYRLRSKALGGAKSMRLAPGVRHDEAAFCTRLETFLEAIDIVGWNDQCAASVRSRRECKGNGGQNCAKGKKYKTE